LWLVLASACTIGCLPDVTTSSSNPFCTCTCAERRYRKLLMSVDLTRNFFFSHTYPLVHTLQRNWEAGAWPWGFQGLGF
jgi:hypothetical protein